MDAGSIDGGILVRPMHLRRLSLKSVRCFESLDLSFEDGESFRRWTFIVGVNGTGKSTILRSCAGAFSPSWGMGDPHAGIPPSDRTCQRIGRESYSFAFELERDGADGRRDRTRSLINGRGPGESSQGAAASGAYPSDSPHAGNLLLAFGPVRSLEVPPARQGLPYPFDDVPAARARRGSAAGLFGRRHDPDLLWNLYAWIRWEEFIALKNAAQQSHRPPVMGALKAAFDRLFDGIASFKGVDSRGFILFDTDDGPVPIEHMADGVRSLFVIVAELVLRLDGAFPDSKNPMREEAVCVIDEIDAHLHPRLQRTVVPALRGLFPNVQFIVTTHSPYVVGAARPEEIVALRRESGRVVVVPHSDIPDVAGWTADAIATSPIFGLDTTRDVRGEQALRTEQELLPRISKLTSGEKRRLDDARKLLSRADGPLTQLVREALSDGDRAKPSRAGEPEPTQTKRRATKRR